MNTRKFAGKASLQVLKTAVSFAAGTVITFFLLYVVVVFERRLGSIRGALRFILLAAFAGVFYLTFKLLEPRMPARKKLLVALLGIVLPLASRFAVAHTPNVEITENLFRWPSPLSSTEKPYEEAIYDVYSAALRGETDAKSPLLLWNKLIDPVAEGVLIQIDTISAGFGSHYGSWGGQPATPPELIPQTEFDKEWSPAMADYDRRNKQSFQLQRKFNLSKYDLISKAQYEALCKPFACQKYAGYERWVKLSAVGFNQDQTEAYLYMEEWRGYFGHGGSRFLHKRNGKWYLILTGVPFDDWIT
jgi:hypothetical protein